MCIIIEQYPHCEVPFEKLQAACKRNSDGFGITYSDGKTLESFKKFDPKGNDPEYVARLLEESRDVTTLLHLRLATVGERNEANCHPYPIKVDNQEFNFCHNGTLYGFEDKQKQFSDSYHFAYRIVQPLLQRSVSMIPVEELLEDSFVADILEEFAGTSVFTLMDTTGKTLWINDNNRGKEFEWGKVSNTYSFATPKPPTAHKPDTSPHYIIGNQNRPQPKTNINKNNKQKTLNQDILCINMRETFQDISDGVTFDDLMYFDSDQILELCVKYPSAATWLILDLLAEVYELREGDMTNGY